MRTQHSLRADRQAYTRGPLASGLFLCCIGLVLGIGACDADYGTGYYAPYGYYYYPDYGDWVFFYDDGDDWWYPDDLTPTLATDLATAAARVSSGSLQPMDAAGKNDKLPQIKASLVAFNTDVVRALIGPSGVTKQQANASPNEVQEYGPQNLPATNPTGTFRLTFRGLGNQKFGWYVRGKPIGADDSHYKTVLIGNLEQAGAAKPDKGMAFFNLNNLHVLNPTAYPYTGHVIAVTGNAVPLG